MSLKVPLFWVIVADKLAISQPEKAKSLNVHLIQRNRITAHRAAFWSDVVVKQDPSHCKVKVGGRAVVIGVSGQKRNVHVSSCDFGYPGLK